MHVLILFFRIYARCIRHITIDLVSAVRKVKEEIQRSMPGCPACYNKQRHTGIPRVDPVSDPLYVYVVQERAMDHMKAGRSR